MPMLNMLQAGAPTAPFSLTATGVTFGDVSIDFAAAQQDTAAEIVVRKTAGGFTTSGNGPIVAIVRIPARQYVETEGGTDPMSGAPAVMREALPLDPNAVTIELWPFAG